ncbi:MAG: hypothetical protein V3575_04625 [Candidatus Absconditabacteria bacterium]
MLNPIEIIKKGFLQGIGLSLGLSIFIFGIFLVKGAWQSSNPTAGQGDATNLYTNGEDILTKEKWNALVEKVNSNNSNSLGWVEVDRDDTTTPFDPYCERRWVYNEPANTVVGSNPSGVRQTNAIHLDGSRMRFFQDSGIFNILSTDKTKMLRSGGGRRYLSKLEKRCN